MRTLRSRVVLRATLILCFASLAACGGSSNGTTSGSASGTSAGSSTGSGSTGGSSSGTGGGSTGGGSTGGGSTGGGSTGSGSSSGTGSSTGTGTGTGSGTGTGTGTGSTGGSSSSTGSGPAALLAAKLGKAPRLLVGLGGQGSNDVVSATVSQTLKPDIFDEYLVGAGSGDWTTWNSPAGAYVGLTASKADQMGAVPMFTLYQMAQNGDGNLSHLTDAAFMTLYWANVRLLFQQLAVYGKPVLVNLEPDFWGYAETASNQDPTQLAASVTLNPDCSSFANNIAGIAQCLIKMARQYAPKAYVGFPPATWGANGNIPQVVAYMNALGAQNADFVVEQTLDRDAGCFEAAPVYCQRSATFYWDESNQTHPNFQDHLAEAQQFHAGIGNLPLIWWQTPLGVPSSTPGGTDYHYRDNRVHYFLTHPTELTAVGGLGVVFGTGENHQTNIVTDGGQFQSLDAAYLRAPAALP